MQSRSPALSFPSSVAVRHSSTNPSIYFEPSTTHRHLPFHVSQTCLPKPINIGFLLSSSIVDPADVPGVWHVAPDSPVLFYGIGRRPILAKMHAHLLTSPERLMFACMFHDTFAAANISQSLCPVVAIALIYYDTAMSADLLRQLLSSFSFTIIVCRLRQA